MDTYFNAQTTVAWRTRLESVAVALAAFLLAFLSSERLPLVWDEGDAFVRAESLELWAEALLFGPKNLTPKERPENGFRSASEEYAVQLADYFAGLNSRKELLKEPALKLGVPHAVYREGHPAGYSIALALGRRLSAPLRGLVSEKQGFRLVGVCLFALALAALYARTGSAFGRPAALCAALLTLCSPRVFAHAQIAGGDSLLVSAWILAWAAFPTALRSKRGAVVWGLALALSFSAKFSGFLIVVPFAAALAFGSTRQPGQLALFALGVAVGLTAFFATEPTLWTRPIDALTTFWNLNTRRDGFNIPVYFFDKLYSPTRPLPWWNGLFWVAAVVPLATLALAALGIIRLATSCKRRTPDCLDADPTRRVLMVSAFALALTLPVVRAFPGLPVHDGARLLVASLPFWSVLAGLGAAFLLERTSRSSAPRRFVVALALVAAVVLAAFDLYRSCPQYLSFYNAAIGGVEGAAEKGLEPTYYWDAFDDEAARALDQFLADAQAQGRSANVLFGAFSSQTLDYCRRWNRLPNATALETISAPNADPNRADFYVAQRRPSGYVSFDLFLLKNARPIYQKTVENPIPTPRFLRKRKASRPVPILAIYDLKALAESLKNHSPSENSEPTRADVRETQKR